MDSFQPLQEGRRKVADGEYIEHGSVIEIYPAYRPRMLIATKLLGDYAALLDYFELNESHLLSESDIAELKKRGDTDEFNFRGRKYMARIENGNVEKLGERLSAISEPRWFTYGELKLMRNIEYDRHPPPAKAQGKGIRSSIGDADEERLKSFEAYLLYAGEISEDEIVTNHDDVKRLRSKVVVSFYPQRTYYNISINGSLFTAEESAGGETMFVYRYDNKKMKSSMGEMERLREQYRTLKQASLERA